MNVDSLAILPATGRPAPISRVRWLSLLATLLFPACLLADTTANPLLPESVLAAAEERIAEGHYQSLIIGIRDDERTEWTSVGRLSDGGPAPRSDTVYEISSLTKPFTAALLSLAAEEGLLSIDDTLAQHAPAERNLDRRLQDDVALWQLATHVSGLPDMPDDLSPDDPARLFEDYSQDALWQFLARHPLAGAPGASYGYSNLGYALLGGLLAETLGGPYGSLLRERITAPLGLDSTAVSPPASVLDRIAPGFDYDLKRAPAWHWPAFEAAGALRSTPEDLMQWVEAHLSPPDDELGRALHRLYQAELSLGDNGQSMGLGWQLQREDDDTLTVWHAGRSAGYAAFIAFQPETRRAVVILANTGNSVEQLGFAALDPQRAVQAVRPVQALDRRLGALYAGRYRLSPGFVLTVRQTSSGLFIRAPGRPPLRLYSVDGEHFFTRGVASELRFVAGADGAIEGMEIHPPRGDVQFADRMQRTESPASREIRSLAPEQLADYAGTYQVNGDTVFDLRPDADRLLLTSGNGPAWPLYPSDDGRFFHRNQPLELHFTQQDDGDPGDGLVLYRNGHRLEAQRVRDPRH
jgi:serine-type D-Ala-D-Ala carboxypeptidase/endopeptidase